MQEIVSWVLRVPFGPIFITSSAVLAFSFFGAPWLMLVHRSREKRGSLIDSWTMFEWVHPVLARLIKWTGAVKVVILVVLAVLVCQES